MCLQRTLALATILGALVIPLHHGAEAAAVGSAVIHIRLSGALNAVATLTGPSSTCQLAYFPATKGSNASPASTFLLIGANTGGISAKPPGANAFAMGLDDYAPAVRSYSDQATLSLVLHHHSYLYSLFDSTSVTVHTSDGAHTGTFQAVGLKPNNGTKGGKVNASGTWSCAGFKKVTVHQP